MATRMKAPTIAPTGCPSCKRVGLPGMPCLCCAEDAHGRAVRAADRELRFGHEAATVRMRCAEDARAAWVGCDVLGEHFDRWLFRMGVGLEVPP